VEEMLDTGMSLEEALNKITARNQKELNMEGFEDTMKEMVNREKEQNKLLVLKNRGEMSAAALKAVEDLLLTGMSLDEALKEIANREKKEKLEHLKEKEDISDIDKKMSKEMIWTGMSLEEAGRKKRTSLATGHGLFRDQAGPG
jgi:hypoxanthine phosphoribosyltransferase